MMRVAPGAAVVSEWEALVSEMNDFVFDLGHIASGGRIWLEEFEKSGCIKKVRERVE